MSNKAGEQCGTDVACKAIQTGSIPALASTSYSEFIEVMRRDDIEEMQKYLSRIYQENYADPNGSPAHDMVRLAASVVTKYADLKERMIEVSKENARLKRERK